VAGILPTHKSDIFARLLQYLGSRGFVALRENTRGRIHLKKKLILELELKQS
jgi:hypothetical protein